jgi:hypothetical protein
VHGSDRWIHFKVCLSTNVSVEGYVLYCAETLKQRSFMKKWLKTFEDIVKIGDARC